MSRKIGHVKWVPLAILPQMLEPLFEEGERRATDLQSVLFEQMAGIHPVVFLTILNINDYRKQIKPVIAAFVRIAKDNPRAVLLVKMSVARRTENTLSDYLFRMHMADAGEIAPPFVSDRIWMTAEPLSREDLTLLLDVAAFYVSTPHGEGQNLPLIEAMARGAVPVAVDHTAMRDYIDHENAVVVSSAQLPFTPRLSNRYRMSGLQTYYVSERDAYSAISSALTLTDAEYASKSGRAIAAVKDMFGLTPFAANFQQVVAAAELHAKKGGQLS